MALSSNAQLSSNPDKFLGNITTSYQIDYGKERFYELWNEITPENESKWGSIERTRGSFNWGNCDKINSYANNHGFPFKFHTLVWGSQFPGWLKNLSVKERYNAIVKWMDAVKKRYPNLAMIDVVNEAVEGHQADTHYIKEALGGGGVTGYDWIVKAFEMAYERWPNAILIYNDFNTFQWNTDQFIDLVKAVRNAGAPIDAYGCQSHDLTDCNISTFKNSMSKIQNALKIPMYITEYDIGTDDDNLQLQRFKEQFPVMWEANYCGGVTLWGYIYGKTWTTNGNSGLIKEGKDSSGKTVFTDRPAMEWLRQYMTTDKAKEAKSPFPGMVKEASVYVKPASPIATKGQPMSIEVRAKMRTKTIEKVQLYVNSKLQATMTEAPFVAEYTPTSKGTYNLRAVVTTTDGSTYERMGAFKAYNARRPYKGTAKALPGVLQMENFDEGGEGLSFHDSDATNSGGASYRSDNEGVDIMSISGGYCIGYSNAGEWLEYTVDVKEAGYYEFTARVSAGQAGGAYSMYINDEGNSVKLLSFSVPQTGNGDWNNYTNVNGLTLVRLEEGTHVLRLVVDAANANIDKITFTHTDLDPENQVFNNLSQLTSGQPFVIVDASLAKAFYGSDNQNLKFDTFKKAFVSSVSGYNFKLEPLTGNSDASIRNYYMLRLLQPDGAEYNIWNYPGYLNSQVVTGTCCFILGLDNKNGMDIKNGAVWDIKYEEGKGFSLKNIGTGKYLKNADAAKYDEPTYFLFCTKGATTAIDEILYSVAERESSDVYTLQGVKVGTKEQWNSLPHGLYIVGGKKVKR